MEAKLRPIIDPSMRAEQWDHKRQEIHNRLLTYIGEFPTREQPPPHHRVLSREAHDDYEQLKIAYEAEPEEEVRAWLLVPPRQKRKRGAAILCLHGTSAEAKDTQIGLGKKPGRDYGRFLAQHGYITLSPDHCCAGERLVAGHEAYDSAPFYARHPEWSMVGKAIFDASRALDVLSNCDGVDSSRFGVVGHSLGGQGALFVGAFDERVKVAVSNYGLAPTWVDNPKRFNFARDRWYKYIPRLRPAFEKGEVPIEMYEFCALIAPRAFMNISGLTDETYGRNDALPEVGARLFELWNLLGKPQAFANFLFGGGHDVPEFSRLATLGWVDQWLAGA
jgi:dienelactone hydrolase